MFRFYWQLPEHDYIGNITDLVANIDTSRLWNDLNCVYSPGSYIRRQALAAA